MTLVLDQILVPIRDKEVPLLIDEGDIARLEPQTVFVRHERLSRCGGVVEVAHHDVRTLQEHLAFEAGFDVDASDGVADSAAHHGEEGTDGAWLGSLDGAVVSRRARLGQSEGLRTPRHVSHVSGGTGRGLT